MAQGKSTANDYFFVRMSIGAHSMAYCAITETRDIAKKLGDCFL
jgi:hypothetical protein